jgi:O-antigen ligase
MILMLLLVSYGRITTTSTEVYNQGNQGSDRITLWQHGIAAISSSPVFGLGPGAHSGDKAPFLDFESHNTFIDWGGSTGMVGLAAYLSLLGWIAGRAWRNGFVVLVGAVISLATFSSFHYVLRHVIFWFYLLSIAHLSDHSLTENHFLVDSIKPIKHQT